MNEEIKNSLAKYMKSNGFYDTKQIRIDEGKSEIVASFMDLFVNSPSDDKPEVMSELLAAANEYNNELDAKKEAETFQAVKTLVAEYDALPDTDDYEVWRRARIIENELNDMGMATMYDSGADVATYRINPAREFIQRYEKRI